MTISAPLYRLPDAQLVSIEYPGPVASTSSSLNIAVGTLGGQDRLTRALSKPDGVVELNFRPENNFSHPVGGETVEAGNMAVLRIVKRRRRAGRKKSKIVGEHLVEEAGAYTIQCVGSIARSVRFIAMADLQYAPPGAHDDPTVKLAMAMRNMDFDTIQRYRFPEPDEDFEGNLRLLPPPVFSRQTVPQIYDYRPNPLSTVVTTTREDGTEYSRLVNKTKYKGDLILTVPFSTPPEDIPTEPLPNAGKAGSKPGLDAPLIDRLHELLDARPVWNRAALLNQLTRQERNKVQNYKAALPVVCWSFSDGPFRDSCIRFGYDPRQHREARMYQRITLRNMQNKSAYLKKVAGSTAAGAGDVTSLIGESQGHIFNGISVDRNVGNYQLCDITDPYLANIIRNEDYVLDECHYRDGWWDMEYFELMRQLVKRKFFAILNDNVQLPDDSFNDLHAFFEEHARTNGLGPYRESGEQDQPELEADNNTEGAEAEGELPKEGTSSYAPKRRVAAIRRPAKSTPKPKALDPAERVRARSRFSMAGEGPSGTPSVAPEPEDTIMEDQEET